MSEGTTNVYIFFVQNPAESQPENQAEDENWQSHWVSPKGYRESLLKSFHKLSRRQREIATLIARDMTNREIAGKLFISHHTVATHVKNILAKTGVPSKPELRYLLAYNGIVPPAEADLYETPGD